MLSTHNFNFFQISWTALNSLHVHSHNCRSVLWGATRWESLITLLLCSLFSDAALVHLIESQWKIIVLLLYCDFLMKAMSEKENWHVEKSSWSPTLCVKNLHTSKCKNVLQYIPVSSCLWQISNFFVDKWMNKPKWPLLLMCYTKHLLQCIIFLSAFFHFNLYLMKALIIYYSGSNFAIILQTPIREWKHSAFTSRVLPRGFIQSIEKIN